MDLSSHLDAIRSDLGSLLGADDALSEAMERMARPMEASLQLRLLDLLGDGALELTEQLPMGHAEVRISGKDATLVYVGAPDAPPPAPPSPDDGGTARLTLRMPDALKNAVEEAADALAISVNAWLVNAVRSALDAPQASTTRRGTGSRISGYATS